MIYPRVWGGERSRLAAGDVPADRGTATEPGLRRLHLLKEHEEDKRCWTGKGKDDSVVFTEKEWTGLAYFGARRRRQQATPTNIAKTGVRGFGADSSGRAKRYLVEADGGCAVKQ
ncbi:hypothetical protein HPP92_023601 [Vanilla planifolia]|uniref:Uncharacterized protein n=1 Tax=Vanilla planifolia TaxID=51239 RepID=A0A835PVN2_VANPL|nr:hypothetical protein HPP92_023601 [Vanilla planifolia]